MMADKKLIDSVSSSQVEMLNNPGKNLTKIETLYTSITCFVANCLSSIALEVGMKSSLGNSVTKSTTFNAFFRRSYNLKIKILVTNVISGLIATLMLTLGDKYQYPYLYIPWLLNTIKGMALFEGPALLQTAYKLIPNAEVPAGSFLIITLILFIEEICLWNDVFLSFKTCWAQYNYRKKGRINTAKEKHKDENRKLPAAINKNDVNLKFDKEEISNPPSETEVGLSKIFQASTISSNVSVASKAPSSDTDNNNEIRSKFTNVTG